MLEDNRIVVGRQEEKENKRGANNMMDAARWRSLLVSTERILTMLKEEENRAYEAYEQAEELWQTVREKTDIFSAESGILKNLAKVRKEEWARAFSRSKRADEYIKEENLEDVPRRTGTGLNPAQKEYLQSQTADAWEALAKAENARVRAKTEEDIQDWNQITRARRHDWCAYQRIKERLEDLEN